MSASGAVRMAPSIEATPPFQAGGDIRKLPKWAQSHVELLRQRVVELERALSESGGPPSTFALRRRTERDPMVRQRFIQPDERVRLYVDGLAHPDSFLEVYPADNGRSLEVYSAGGQGILVRPRVSNVVTIHQAQSLSGDH